MLVLNEAAWRSRILLGEQWVEPDGDYAVVEPATGAELSRMGRASADDVRTAAAVAVDAQREWAARPHRERAAVMRRAGDLWHERADDVAWWNIREVGAVPGMADFAIGVAADECYEAASLPSHPSGAMRPRSTRLPHRCRRTRRVACWPPTRSGCRSPGACPPGSWASSRRSTSRSSWASAPSHPLSLSVTP
ncbi:MAG TPA: aldehyde dehydrogenase family protein [Nocardioidaceae bacterium]|nr:aldehyde dehydrogenase family protein [Nocardioidaceae bacterium]